MAASDKRENSVLFSLRELRQIEDDRVKGEADAARQKVEDEKRAREDEIRRVREESERKQREIEDAERARLEAQERQEREDSLRLEETERKHRVEAQARLEEERLRLEIEHKTKVSSNKRIKILIAVAGALSLIVGLMIFFVVRANSEREQQELLSKQELAKRDAAFVELKKALDDELAKSAQLKADSDSLVAELDKTFDEGKRARLKAELQAKRDELQRSADRQKAIRDRAEAARRAPVNVKCANPNDPLCGAN